MPAPVESSVSLVDVYRGIFRHKWKAGAFFAGTIVAAFLIAISMSESYRSEAKLLFALGPETSVDPAASPDRGINVADPREGMVNSALDILRSREMLEQVADDLGTDRILNIGTEQGNEPDGSLSRIKSAVRSAKQLVRLGSELSAQEKAIQKLGTSIQIGAEKRSPIVSINCKAESPELAQQICSALVDNYRAHHIAIHRSTASVTELEKRLVETKAELNAARKTQQDLNNKVGPAADVQRSIARGRHREREAVLRDILRENNELIRSGQWTGEEFAGLDNEGEIGPAKLAGFSVAPELRPLFEQAVRQHGKAAKTLRFFAQHELSVANLVDKIARLRDQVDSLEKRLAEAEIKSDLSQERISSIKIAQHPTLVKKPDGPKRSLILVLGALLAFTGSLGLVFLCEVLDSTLRTTEDVERALHLPVLVSIPRKNSRSFQLN